MNGGGGFDAWGSLGRIRALGGDFRRWAARGLDLVYPPCCAICRAEPRRSPGAAVDPRPFPAPGEWPEGVVCAACLRELAADVPRCPCCGDPAARADACRSCAKRRCEWRHMAVLSGYAGGLRQAVLRSKRPAGEQVAAALATLLHARHREALLSWNVDRVVPVPMHWWRRARRGTSAADELSRTLAALMGVPWSRALARRRATPMQNELPVERRSDNVRDAFRPRARLAGLRVLLVDDVVTTGSTLAACTRTLHAAGASSVDVAVVARADRSAEA